MREHVVKLSFSFLLIRNVDPGHKCFNGQKASGYTYFIFISLHSQLYSTLNDSIPFSHVHTLVQIWIEERKREQHTSPVTSATLRQDVDVGTECIQEDNWNTFLTILSRHVRRDILLPVYYILSLNVMVCQPGTILYSSDYGLISRLELTSAHEEITTTCLDIHVEQLWYSTVTIIHIS